MDAVSYGALRSPSRNEIRLGGFVPVNFVLEMCVRVVISEYASLVRKSYSMVSGPDSTLVLAKKPSEYEEGSIPVGSSLQGQLLRMMRQADDHNDC